MLFPSRPMSFAPSIGPSIPSSPLLPTHFVAFENRSVKSGTWSIIWYCAMASTSVVAEMA